MYSLGYRLIWQVKKALQRKKKEKKESFYIPSLRSSAFSAPLR